MLTEERLIYFQNQIQDIRDFKTNQWRFSNYGVLIQAALTTVDINLGISSSPWVLSLISVGTFGAILWLIYETMEQIVFRRSAYETLMEPIDESFKAVYCKFRKQKNEKPPLSRTLNAAGPFAILFLGVQAMAMGLAIWVIWSGGPSITPCSSAAS